MELLPKFSIIKLPNDFGKRGRIMGNSDLNTNLVNEGLEIVLENEVMTTITPTAIAGDQD